MNLFYCTRRDCSKAAGLVAAAVAIPGCTNASQQALANDMRPNK